MKTRRDNQGKLRIAKGDKSGLGGQYAFDLDAAKRNADALNNLSNINSDSDRIANAEIPEHIRKLMLTIAERANDYRDATVSKNVYMQVESLHDISDSSVELYAEYKEASQNNREKIIESLGEDNMKFWMSGLSQEAQNDVKTTLVMSEIQRSTALIEYASAAIWTDVEEEEPKTIYDIHPAHQEKAFNEFNRFVAENPELVTDYLKLKSLANAEKGTAIQLGHDLWLTRTRQGAGFWDRPELKYNDTGKKLTKAVETSLPPVSLIIGDDGQLYYE